MLICLSASHWKIGLPLLESLAFHDENEVMKTFCSERFAQECILLQTCHRVEIYCAIKDSVKEDAVSRILKFWSIKAGVSADLLSKIVEAYKGREALAHLFYVAAGLESVIVGEDQILGQMRTAYVKAKKLGTAGLILEKSFMKAVNTGRRIRNETKINEGSISISSTAVDLAEKELGDLKYVRTLVIGAGEAGSIVTETLKRRGTKSITIANRTYERGLDLARKVSGSAIEFNYIHETIPKNDLVIAAVSVERPILEAKQVRKVLTESGSPKPIFIFDISQPRAVEEKVGSLQGVTLKNLDDLKRIVEENIRNREAEAEKSKKIIWEELERFERQLSKILVAPMISEIFKKIEDIRQKELERAIGKMGESDKKKLTIMDRFSRELVERIMQIPIEQVREAALNNNSMLLVAADQLFKIRLEEV